MRIMLKRGKQRELILLAKKNSWPALAKQVGMNPVYLCNEVSNEKVLLDEKLYKKLEKIAKVDFSEYVLKRLEDNWGKKKGGRLSIGNKKKIKIPKESEELAEFYGIMLGDGNSTKIKDYKKGTYMIRIVGDHRYDKDYLINYVGSLIKTLFDIEIKYGRFKETNAIFIQVHSAELIQFLEELGFKPGNKIKNRLEIPKWIFDNPLYLKRCVRGLIDTDGSIFRMSKKDKNLLRISFTNYNPKLISGCQNAFTSLGFHPSKIISKKQFFISKKEDIEKYLREIGFSNSKHIYRLQKFRDSPIV